MSGAELVGALERKKKDLAEVVHEMKELEEYGLESAAGHLSFTVLSVTDKMGGAIDAQSLRIQVEMREEEAGKGEGNAEDGAAGVFHIDEHAKEVMDTFSIMLDSKEVPLKVICHRQFSIVQPDEDVLDGDEAGVNEQASVKSVPYTASFDMLLLMKDEPANTTFTCELEATCTEEPPMILHVKAAFHDCQSLMSSKVQEALMLQGIIQELTTSLEEEKNKQEEQPKSAGAAGGKNPSKEKEKKKVKKTKASKPRGEKVKEVLWWVYENPKYFLFSGAAAAIYFYGEYASV